MPKPKKPSPTGKPTPKPSKRPKGGRTPPTKVLSYAEHYARFVPVAREIDAHEVIEYRGDVKVGLANVKTGLASVLATASQVAFAKEHLPRVDWDAVRQSADLARAVLFAAGKVVARAASPREIEAKLRDILDPRDQLLQTAEVLAKRGKLDAALVKKIRAGSGNYDKARDGVELVALFMENEKAVRGQHPFTRDELERIRETSEWLLENMKPAGARGPAPTKNDHQQVRDRLWTLLTQRYADLRKLGFYLHGDAVDDFVPKLQSRVATTAIDEEPPPEEETAPQPPA